MANEDSKDLLKNMDWKTIGNSSTSAATEVVTKKRLPKRIRQVPDYYFLPRQSLPSAIALYGAICAAGVGAGMLLEVWIKKKIRGEFILHVAFVCMKLVVTIRAPKLSSVFTVCYLMKILVH